MGETGLLAEPQPFYRKFEAMRPGIEEPVQITFGDYFHDGPIITISTLNNGHGDEVNHSLEILADLVRAESGGEIFVDEWGKYTFNEGDNISIKILLKQPVLGGLNRLAEFKALGRSAEQGKKRQMVYDRINPRGKIKSPMSLNEQTAEALINNLKADLFLAELNSMVDISCR